MPSDRSAYTNAGLHPKYTVACSDGAPLDPNAEFFVLDPKADIHARAALCVYACAVMEDNPRLATELLAAVERAKSGKNFYTK